MGCVQSNNRRIAAAHSKKIDMELEKESKLMKKQLKLLLLGAGESGKSTIVKQSKIINSGGFSELERIGFKNIVYDNIFHSAIAVIHGMSTLEMRFSDISLKSDSDYLLSIEHTYHETPERIPQLMNIVKKLFNDSGFRSTLVRSSEFPLNDSAEYFFESLNRICATDYVPTQEDVLRTRVRTSGIVETKFKHREFEITLCDVGGQRSERKKWIHCFENVSAILFVVALSEYDLTLREDIDVNRMWESLTLFRSICENSLFYKTDIILLLNKIDLFAQKIKHIPITVCFQDYNGPNTYEDSREYIRQRFLDSAKLSNPQKQIYYHFTCATDTSSLQFVFNALTDAIIMRNLKNCGLC